MSDLSERIRKLAALTNKTCRTDFNERTTFKGDRIESLLYEEFVKARVVEHNRLLPLIEALVECAELLSDSLRIIDHPVGVVPEDAYVQQLGEQIGYGAMMDSARRCWRELLKLDGIAGGEFTVGPCRSTVEGTLARLERLVGGE